MEQLRESSRVEGGLANGIVVLVGTGVGISELVIRSAADREQRTQRALKLDLKNTY